MPTLSKNNSKDPAVKDQPEDTGLAISHALLNRLVDNGQSTPSKEPVQVQVKLYKDPRTPDKPKLELEIGTDRLYTVRHLSDFLEALASNQPLEINRAFTFNPERHCFAAQDQALIEMLLEAHQDEHNSWNYYFGRSEFSKGSFELNQSRFKRFLEVAATMQSAFWVAPQLASPVPILICRDSLPFVLHLTEGRSHPELELKHNQPFYELTPDEVYFCGDCFYLPSAANREMLRPILNAFSQNHGQPLPISKNDAAVLISDAVPLLKPVIRFEMEPEVATDLRKEPLVITIWLDQVSGGGISARVVFQYGAVGINPLVPIPDDEAEPIIREKRREEAFIHSLSDVGFRSEGDAYQLRDEDALFYFLRDTLPELTEIAEVYRSESFNRLRIGRPPKLNGSVRLNETSDLLEVAFEMEALSPAELQEFFRALRERRKYIRLKAGYFIPLDQPETIAIGNLLTGLGLSGHDLQKELITLPKYRAIYLEQMIREYGRERFNLNHAFQELIHSIKEPQDMEWQPPQTLLGVLRDYQKTGFKWLKTLSYYGFGGILADDMGLGKTLEVIAFVQSEYPERRLPSLVVAPTSLLYNWEEEVRKFAPSLSVLVLDGPKTERLERLAKASDYVLIVTSYSLLRRDVEALRELKFAYCFLDEAQHIKNPETNNAKSVKEIKASGYFALTGTPIENSLTELWSIFDFIMPGYLYSRQRFRNRFEIPVVKNNDPVAQADLRMHINPFILRRLKKDVLRELPEKIETRISCEMTEEQKKAYLAYLSRARAEFEAEIAENGFEKSRIKILALLTRLRQICCHPALFLENYHGGSGKLDLLRELARDSLAGGHRILLFSQFVTMLNLIERQFRTDGIRLLRIDGQTGSEERLQRVEAFNSGTAEIFLVSLKAGGTGLNLTGADTVIHYDPWWNPAVEDQATDRAYRIGQLRTVQVFKLLARGTIEERIAELQERKRSLIDAVIQPGENFLNRITMEEVKRLFED